MQLFCVILVLQVWLCFTEKSVDALFAGVTPALIESKAKGWKEIFCKSFADMSHQMKQQVQMFFCMQSKGIVHVVLEILIASFGRMCLVVLALGVNGCSHWTLVAGHMGKNLEKVGWHLLRVLIACGEERKPKCWIGHNRIFRG
jgi:hypothetical protein